MEQSTFKRKEVPFSQVSNTPLRDNTISLKAKGLYGLIQSYVTIPGFTLYYGHLKKQCKESDHAFSSAMKELREAGYLVQTRCKGKGGKFYYEYELNDYPSTTVEQSSASGLSGSGKPPLYNNNDLSNTELNKTELSNNMVTLSDLNGHLKTYSDGYEFKFGKSHPRISETQWAEVDYQIAMHDFDEEMFQWIAARYFNTLPKSNDGNVNAFVKVLKRLEADYYDEVAQ